MDKIKFINIILKMDEKKCVCFCGKCVIYGESEKCIGYDGEIHYVSPNGSGYPKCCGCGYFFSTEYSTETTCGHKCCYLCATGSRQFDCLIIRNPDDDSDDDDT